MFAVMNMSLPSWGKAVGVRDMAVSNKSVKMSEFYEGFENSRSGAVLQPGVYTLQVLYTHKNRLYRPLVFILCMVTVNESTGRSGTLGELTVNLSGYSSSETSISIAELLKNCSYGTILQAFGMESMRQDIVHDNYHELKNLKKEMKTMEASLLKTATQLSYKKTDILTSFFSFPFGYIRIWRTSIS
ncbi:hypothetical protein Tco_0941491 [Tanacetum coccineum]|uniref:TNF family profile domain-containing protein n=1 Tax=Tanacetum coccineum TaxID=301880 RepID=A0ABQ5DTL7_9ASTR